MARRTSRSVRSLSAWGAAVLGLVLALTTWAPTGAAQTLVDRVVARVSPQYGQNAMAECGAPVTADKAAEMSKTNAAASFLLSVPCGPDGKPLDPNAPQPATAAGAPR